MTFTYTNTLLTSKDKVRFRIGDTDSTAATTERLEDEEINAIVAAQPLLHEAMALCCEALAAKFFKVATTKALGTARVGYEKRVDYYFTLAEKIRFGSDAAAAADIVITGTTQTELDESAADTDLVQLQVKAGRFDNLNGTTTAVETA